MGRGCLALPPKLTPKAPLKPRNSSGPLPIQCRRMQDPPRPSGRNCTVPPAPLRQKASAPALQLINDIIPGSGICKEEFQKESPNTHFALFDLNAARVRPMSQPERINLFIRSYSWRYRRSQRVIVHTGPLRAAFLLLADLLTDGFKKVHRQITVFKNTAVRVKRFAKSGIPILALAKVIFARRGVRNSSLHRPAQRSFHRRYTRQ